MWWLGGKARGGGGGGGGGREESLLSFWSTWLRPLDIKDDTLWNNENMRLLVRLGS